MTLAEYSRRVNAALAWESEGPVFAGDLIPCHAAGRAPAAAAAAIIREREEYRNPPPFA